MLLPHRLVPGQLCVPAVWAATAVAEIFKQENGNGAVWRSTVGGLGYQRALRVSTLWNEYDFSRQEWSFSVHQRFLMILFLLLHPCLSSPTLGPLISTLLKDKDRPGHHAWNATVATVTVSPALSIKTEACRCRSPPAGCVGASRCIMLIINSHNCDCFGLPSGPSGYHGLPVVFTSLILKMHLFASL